MANFGGASVGSKPMKTESWITAMYLFLLASYPSFSCAEFESKVGHSQRLEIPFELYNDHLVVVKGSIGHLKDVRIMLDTGKSPSAISKEIAGQLGLKGKAESLIFFNGELTVESVVLPQLNLGAWRVASLRVLVQDLGFLRRSIKDSIGAIAGLDVLRTKNFLIDYRRKKIVFGPVKPLRNSVQFSQQNPFLIVNAQIDGQRLRLLADSGTYGVLVYRERLKTNPAGSSARQDASVSTAAGSMPTERFHASRVQVGDANLGPKDILIADVIPDPRYGFDGLLGFAQVGFQKVWFDFQHGMLAWE